MWDILHVIFWWGQGWRRRDDYIIEQPQSCMETFIVSSRQLLASSPSPSVVSSRPWLRGSLTWWSSSSPAAATAFASTTAAWSYPTTISFPDGRTCIFTSSKSSSPDDGKLMPSNGHSVWTHASTVFGRPHDDCLPRKNDHAALTYFCMACRSETDKWWKLNRKKNKNPLIPMNRTCRNLWSVGNSAVDRNWVRGWGRHS